MKTLLHTPLTLLLLLGFFLFSRPCLGNKDSLYSIEVKGKVVIPENDPSKMYKLELLYDNGVIESGIIVDEECFLLRIKNNTHYTIRLVKEGYVPMVISIDTRLKNNSNIFSFTSDFFLNQYGFQLSLTLDKFTVQAD